MSYLIEQHLVALRAEGMAQTTIHARGRCLRRLNDDLPYGWLNATTAWLREWLAHEAWSPNTRYTYTGHVKGGFEWLHAEGYLQHNPAAPIRRPKMPPALPRPWTDEQLAQMLTAPEPLRTAVLLAAYEGMRRAEISRCCREHITEAWVTIPVAKGGAAQTVPTHPLVWEHVRHIEPSPDPRRPRPLIADQRGQLSPDQLGVMANRWQKKRGLPTGLHPGRHWCGTETQRSGRNIRVTQRVLRHKSLGSTQIYTDVSDRELMDTLQALPQVGLSRGVTGSTTTNAA